MPQNQSDNPGGGSGGPTSQSRTAAYIADLIREMEQLARIENIGRLESLLREARHEAARFAGAD